MDKANENITLMMGITNLILVFLILFLEENLFYMIMFALNGISFILIWGMVRDIRIKNK